MNEAIDILIEKFINKELGIKEAREFEHRLATDKEFSENYRATLAAHQLIEEAGRLELKNKLDDFSQKVDIAKSKKVIPLWVKRVLPVAAILVIFLSVYQFVLFNSSLTVSEIYDTHFEMYSAPSELRDSNGISKTNWEEGVSFYRNGKYEEAINRFSEAEPNVPQYLTSFYTGISSMAQSKPNYEMAIQNLNEVIKTDNDYRQQAKWYKSLALLKMDRKVDALSIIDEIVKERSFNFKKAEEISKTSIKD